MRDSRTTRGGWIRAVDLPCSLQGLRRTATGYELIAPKKLLARLDPS